MTENTPTPGPSMDEYRASNAPGSGLSEREALQTLVSAFNWRASVLVSGSAEKLHFADAEVWKAIDVAQAALASRQSCTMQHTCFECGDKVGLIFCGKCAASTPLLASRSTEPGGEALTFPNPLEIVQALTPQARSRTSPENIADVLLAIAAASTPPPISASKPGDSLQKGRSILAAAKKTAVERGARQAYDNTYHKVRADIGYDDWLMIWRKAIDWWTEPDPANASKEAARGLPKINRSAGGELPAELRNQRAKSEPCAPVLTDAARDVLSERQRQISAEGWTPEHDDKHADNSMQIAAACYALVGTAVDPLKVAGLWAFTGWANSWFKVKDKRRNLTRAAALILAEIERIDRAASTTQPPATKPSHPAREK